MKQAMDVREIFAIADDAGTHASYREGQRGPKELRAKVRLGLERPNTADEGTTGAWT
jgi:hypothetical protein